MNNFLTSKDLLLTAPPQVAMCVEGVVQWSAWRGNEAKLVACKQAQNYDTKVRAEVVYIAVNQSVVCLL